MRKYLPLLLLFILFNLIFTIFRENPLLAGYDINFILVANIILFALTVLGFLIVTGKAGTISTHAFMRGIYLSFLLKMFVIVTALFIFISVFRQVNKPAIFVSMGMYIVYTGVEVFQLMKMVRNTQK